jgi:hypothetical protein
MPRYKWQKGFILVNQWWSSFFSLKISQKSTIESVFWGLRVENRSQNPLIFLPQSISFRLWDKKGIFTLRFRVNGGWVCFFGQDLHIEILAIHLNIVEHIGVFFTFLKIIECYLRLNTFKPFVAPIEGQRMRSS